MLVARSPPPCVSVAKHRAPVLQTCGRGRASSDTSKNFRFEVQTCSWKAVIGASCPLPRRATGVKLFCQSRRVVQIKSFHSTNRFCGETYILAGVLKSQVFKLCFGAKNFGPGKSLQSYEMKKIGEANLRQRWDQPRQRWDQCKFLYIGRFSIFPGACPSLF